MRKMGVYLPTEKFKNYSLPTSKPLSSHAFYHEKEWTLQEQIYGKLKKVAKLLENLYPKLSDEFSRNINAVIEKNFNVLIEDLFLMQKSLKKDPDSFNTNKLRINSLHINEMKEACDNLQTVRSYEYEFKNLSKIKHALHELEHLIRPVILEKTQEKAPSKNLVKPVLTKKGKTKMVVKKAVAKKAVAKKAPAAKRAKPAKKVVKKAAPRKSAVKKVTKSKPKALTKRVVKAKPRAKAKSAAKKK